MALGEAAEVLHHDGSLQLATWRDIFIQRWIADGRPDQLERMYEMHSAFVAKHGDLRTLSISALENPTLKPPGEEVRSIMTKHTIEVVPRVLASGTIVAPGGFTSAIARGVISGLLLVSRSQRPHAVFGTPREAFAFVLRHRETGAAPSELDEADAMYAQLRARPSSRAR